ncbi:MAG: tetratricopeptide repeat protein [Schlesneria sp.]|nr:tetratricopeptide repeat protein [Schlesneria sp.]
MSHEPRVLELLAELLDTESTPENVCRSCPDLLPEVRERWYELCQARSELDLLFPPFQGGGTAAPPQKDAPLPKISGYEVESVLGQGGMGVVFRVRHLGLNRIVALKMVLAGEYASPRERERFQREAEAVAGLRHPNVVQVYDVGASDGRPFFTMEYVEGGSLSRKLDGAPQPPREAATLLATLSDAIHAAHQGGIVHRDLKPSNVLLTAAGTPKISDFGLARRLDDEAALTRTGTAVGTPSYMAPEQAAGKRVAAEPAIDIYALGAILYELLTGRPPFRAGTAAETVQQVLTRDPLPPSRLHCKVPRDLEIICLKCLRKDPAFRYADASALKEDLGCFLRGEAITARPEGRFERLTRRVRQRPELSAALVLGMLFTGFTISAGMWLIAERAATARRMDADKAAAERAADEHLREMVENMNSSSWVEALAALERAKAWLGTQGSEELQTRVAQGGRDLELAARLDAIRLTGYTRVGAVLDFTRTDEKYEAAFHEAGLGRVGDSPEEVAARVKASHIRNALVSALDYWSVCTPDPGRRRWVDEVTERADGEANAWRARAHDPAIWKDKAALFNLIDTAPVPELSVTLLLAIEFVATVGSDTRLDFLKRVHSAHPRDFWVNMRLAAMLTNYATPSEAIGYYQAAAALRPGVGIVHHNLGILLSDMRRYDEALAQLRDSVRLDPTAAFVRCDYARILLVAGRHVEVIEEAEEALRLGLESALIHTILGKSLEATNRPLEALAELRRTVVIDPKHRDAHRELRNLLLRLGRADELLDAWAACLAADPPDHDDWYGYAELCLFLGRDEAYLRTRRSLLAKFGATTDPYIAERISRACLLRSAAGNELKQAVILAFRAVDVDRSKYQGVYHAFLFVKGLAEYRQGQYDLAISTMEGDASRALGPAPRLVIAMAQHRSGSVVRAQKTLAEAVSTYDWRPERIRDQDGWICHLIRREAEELILPDLPALLDGTRQPRDNDERLIMLGGYLFAKRFPDSARLYADIFAADPNLVWDLATAHRFNAARYAALAGCGPCEKGANIGDPEREKWRAQARRWLSAELASCRSALDMDPVGQGERVRVVLVRIRESLDLAGLREPNELVKLTADERKDCHALWDELVVLINRTDGPR